MRVLHDFGLKNREQIEKIAYHPECDRDSNRTNHSNSVTVFFIIRHFSHENNWIKNQEQYETDNKKDSIT